MALINSDAQSGKIAIESSEQLVRILNGLIADESGATALYSKVRDSVKSCPLLCEELKKDILSRLNEIRNDEIQHTGSLLQMIALLDNSFVVDLNKGGKGE